jgi:hypothetical protein
MKDGAEKKELHICLSSLKITQFAPLRALYVNSRIMSQEDLQRVFLNLTFCHSNNPVKFMYLLKFFLKNKALKFYAVLQPHLNSLAIE